ncbi:DUF695 domain-containing protein [Aliiroseovarius marinus]|uniref:DUF695 domain-containing protein n=1 Tax=Aliiroseovarius marinus TaxID=2500159 RepID=UPI00105BCE72|nr:DUF695 domain-containing protein [Aliiroseovarius marinus]
MTEDNIQLELPEPVFSLLNTSRGGLPAVVVVNGALLNFPHLEIFPWRLSIKVSYSVFAENEMPTVGEQEILNSISDKIEAAVLGSLTEFGSINTLFVARSTWAGTRELIFHVHDPDRADSTLQTLLGNEDWRRDWAYEMQHDPEWNDASAFLYLFSNAIGDGN